MQYKFNGINGGLRSFAGVLHSAKDITTAERDLAVEASGRGKITISYADGCKYTLECDRAETDEKITLTNITETWYNGMETIGLTGGG